MTALRRIAETLVMELEALVILGLAVALLVALLRPAAAQNLRVIDGDTIAYRGETIRIRGLDAPEIHGRCEAEIRLAERARDRLAELLAGGLRVYPQGRDRYRRVLAVVRDARGRDVARILITEGLARPYDGRGQRGGWC
jgi:micrococcal nuclease